MKIAKIKLDNWIGSINRALYIYAEDQKLEPLESVIKRIAKERILELPTQYFGDDDRKASAFNAKTGLMRRGNVSNQDTARFLEFCKRAKIDVPNFEGAGMGFKKIYTYGTANYLDKHPVKASAEMRLELAGWWEKLTKKDKKEYIEEHPRSKYAEKYDKWMADEDSEGTIDDAETTRRNRDKVLRDEIKKLRPTSRTDDRDFVKNVDKEIPLVDTEGKTEKELNEILENYDRRYTLLWTRKKALEELVKDATGKTRIRLLERIEELDDDLNDRAYLSEMVDIKKTLKKK